MDDIRVLNHDGVFSCRVGAVCYSEDRFLLHRAQGDVTWAFPGGKLKMNETLAAAVERELHEELGWTVTAQRLLWVVENFFDYRSPSETAESSSLHHEVGFYFSVEAPEAPSADSHFVSTETDGRLEFRWFHVDEIGALDLRPRVLKDLLGDLSGTTQVVIQRDS